MTKRPKRAAGIHSGPVGQHALKHGRYTADAVARRREIQELLRAMNALASNGKESY
jgi:hypothetical protein